MQEDIAQTVKALSRLLDRAVQGGEDDVGAVCSSDCLRLFHQFHCATWGRLVDSAPTGAALATAACMPVWEMLNTFTAAGAIVDVRKRSFIVQLLTSMYPKARDRRCLFQQVDGLGRGPASAVPLYARAPDSSLGKTVVVARADGAVSVSYRAAMRASLTSGDAAWSESSAAAHIADLTRKVLPSCVIMHTEESGSAGGAHAAHSDQTAIRLDDVSLRETSWRAFALMLWKSIVMAEMHCPSEAKALTSFLTTSTWAHQSVLVGGEAVSYASIFTPFVDACMVCLSLNPRVASTAAANTALIDPAVTRSLAVQDRSLGCIDMDATDTLSLAYPAHDVLEPASVAAVDKSDKIRDMLQQTVPGEVMFFGASSSCRDCDQLTLLAREMLFAPATARDRPKGMNVNMLRECMFNRKRNREGPCLLPVSSSLADTMSGDTSNEKQSTLERLCQTVFSTGANG